MPEINNKNIVEMLRERTEESDLERYLKSTIGGYTKKSVLEYISTLRKQQQSTIQTFNQNIQALIEEKENFRAQYEILQLKLAKLEAEHKSLSESMIAFSIDDGEFSIQDISALQSTITALEMEIRKRDEANRNLEREIKRIEDDRNQTEKALEISRQETRIQQELLLTQKESSQKDRNLVVQLSGTVEELHGQIRYLKATMSDGKIAELGVRINEMLASISAQEDIINQKNEQLFEKEKDIHLLAEECDTLKKTLAALTDTMDTVTVQNEKLTASKMQAMEKLDELYKGTLSLISDKSDLLVEKLILSRKLDSANLKLSMYEAEERKRTRAEETEQATDTAGMEETR